MKKVIFPLLLLCIFVGIAHGQKLQLGIAGSLAFATQNIEDASVVSTNSITTYALHAIGRYHWKGNYYLQAGLGIAGKGIITYQDFPTTTNTIKLTYLDIPLDVLYKLDLPRLGNIFVGGGPYFSLGLSGNLATLSNSSTNERLTFGSGQDYKSIDAGLQLLSSVELNNHLTFNLNYEYGLNNLATESQIAGGYHLH